METLIRSDERFEITAEVLMGLVCFRLKGGNERNEVLLKKLNGRGVIHLVPSKIDDVFFLRVAICSRFSEQEDMDVTWKEICDTANEVLAPTNGQVNGFH